MIIPKSLVTGICSLEVNEAYLAFLTQLNQKMDYSEKAKQEFAGGGRASTPAAIAETEPHLQNLRHKAVAKIREFLLQKIYLLTKPKTNIQIFQETSFAKYRYFYVFLSTYAEDVAAEVHQAYVNTMAKIYVNHFTNYVASLGKICNPTLAGKTDLIGVPEEKKGGGMGLSFGSIGGFFGGSGAAVAAAKAMQVSIFALGMRKDELDAMENPIVPHVAVQLKQKFPYVFFY